MGTGISRLGVGLVALTLGLAGCGGSAGAGGGRAGAGGGSGTSGPFSWLHPQSAPGEWRAITIPTGATMAYPPTWRRQHSDAGTASAVLQTPGGAYLGYLNLTPRQGEETLANWSSFRVEHNAEEGDRHVRRLAAASGLHFLTGHGSCIKDAYATAIGAHYTEVACLLAGRRGESVIVAAAPPTAWSRESGTLERAIESVRIKRRTHCAVSQSSLARSAWGPGLNLYYGRPRVCLAMAVRAWELEVLEAVVGPSPFIWWSPERAVFPAIRSRRTTHNAGSFSPASSSLSLTWERQRRRPVLSTASIGSLRGRGTMTPRRMASNQALRLNPKVAMHSVIE